jgi:hypothetical protein
MVDGLFVSFTGDRVIVALLIFNFIYGGREAVWGC